MPVTYPDLGDARRIARLDPPSGNVNLVLDTDTYNEIDDQFAVVYALLSSERITMEAIHAAPFFNHRSNGPEQGMERSYEEILRLLERLDRSPNDFVFKGSKQFMSGPEEPVESPAARDLVKRAMQRKASDAPLYVAAIGAPTNVASAILIEPAIVERIVVVWLGGQPHYWHSAYEFNFKQDLHATRILFDSGVPLVQIPCQQVAEQLRTTLPEMEALVKGRGAIGDYLYEIYTEFVPSRLAQSKVIWDISAIAWLLDAGWAPGFLAHSPLVSSEFTYSVDPRRHLIRVVRECRRDQIFGDLFGKLESGAADS